MRKMRAVQFLLLITIGLAVAGCSRSSAKSVSDIFAAEERGLRLLHYEKGNFTGSGKSEYIAFYEDPKNKHDPKALTKIDLLEIFVLDSLTVLKKIRLSDIWSLGYDARSLAIIKSFRLGVAEWNGYSYNFDFNRNGRDEILFLTLSGYIFIVRIFEYIDGEFRTVLEYPSGSSISEMTFDDKTLTFTIYDSGGEGVPEGKKNWSEMTWDPALHQYIFSRKGMED